MTVGCALAQNINDGRYYPEVLNAKFNDGQWRPDNNGKYTGGSAGAGAGGSAGGSFGGSFGGSTGGSAGGKLAARVHRIETY